MNYFQNRFKRILSSVHYTLSIAFRAKGFPLNQMNLNIQMIRRRNLTQSSYIAHTTHATQNLYLLSIYPKGIAYPNRRNKQKWKIFKWVFIIFLLYIQQSRLSSSFLVTCIVCVLDLE